MWDSIFILMGVTSPDPITPRSPNHDLSNASFWLFLILVALELSQALPDPSHSPPSHPLLPIRHILNIAVIYYYPHLIIFS